MGRLRGGLFLRPICASSAHLDNSPELLSEHGPTFLIVSRVWTSTSTRRPSQVSHLSACPLCWDFAFLAPPMRARRNAMRFFVRSVTLPELMPEILRTQLDRTLRQAPGFKSSAPRHRAPARRAGN